jgi:hypothetical protein
MDDTTTLSSVRRELNQKFDALPIFKRDRASALYHFRVAVEMSTYPRNLPQLPGCLCGANGSIQPFRLC